MFVVFSGIEGWARCGQFLGDSQATLPTGQLSCGRGHTQRYYGRFFFLTVLLRMSQSHTCVCLCALQDGHNAMSFALGFHRTLERRRQENIAAVSCLLSRNADLPSSVPEVCSYDETGQSKHISTFQYYRENLTFCPNRGRP